jgi:nucleoid-associated protein YgaU
MALEKAYIKFLEPWMIGGSRGGPTTVRGHSKIDFKFNPKEYTIQKSASWDRKPSPAARKASPPEFKGAQGRSLTLELFLDETDSKAGDVSEIVETLFDCLAPLHKMIATNRPLPPFVMFGWGGTQNFTAYLKSVSAKYTLFRDSGVPMRAVCTVTMEEVPDGQARQNPTSGGLAPLRTHTVVEGDTLQSIAYREYHDPTLWRALAEANHIDDPFRLRAGRTLRVPQPADASHLG